MEGQRAILIDRFYWGSGDSLVVHGIFHGPLPNKSNSRRLVKIRGNPLFIKSSEAIEYERKFLVAAKYSAPLPQFPEKTKLYLKVLVYQENLRRDLDCELLPDLLQKVGLIKNDRWIWRKEYERQLDAVNPRAELEVGIL